MSAALAQLARRVPLAVAAVFALAFAVRLAYVLEISDTPFFNRPIIDAKMYDEQAVRVAGGEPIGAAVFNQAPLYPYFLALIYRVLGHDYFRARCVQALLGAVNCALVMVIGRRVFNQRVGLLAGVMTALYGTLVFYDAELLRPVLVIFLSLCILLRLFAAAERPTAPRWAFAGLLLGLTAVAWETVLLFLPGALLWLHLSLRGRERPWRIAWFGALLCLGVGAAILPVTVRNWRVSGDIVLISGWGGVNFFLGNNPEADRTTAIQPGEEWDDLVERPARLAGITRPSERSRWFYREALAFIREHPLQWARLLARKLLAFWSAVEYEPNNNLAYYRQHSAVFRALYQPDWPIALPFGFVGPLALVGAALLPRRGEKARLLLLFALASLLALVLYHVRARYRLPAVPILILFAAWGIQRLIAGFRGAWGRRAQAAAVCALLAATVAVNADVLSLRGAAPFPLAASLGKLHLENGRLDLSRAAFLQAVAENPGDADALVNLGVIAEREGRGEEALARFSGAVAVQPAYAVAHNNLGVWFNARGMTAQAIEALRMAVRLRPDYADAHRNLGIVYAATGRLAEAETEFLVALQLRPRDANARFNLGTTYLALQRPREAAAAFRAVLESDPGNPEAGRAYRRALEAATK